MSWIVLVILLAACAVVLLLEWRGVPTTLELHFKGDVKRETRWLAQYGQSVCTPIAALLVFQLDGGGKPVAVARAIAVLAGVGAASLLTAILKRSLGRIRPGRENAGRFTGPSWKHANYRESFPSSHSACAIALSGLLAAWYPPAAATFWGLAGACAVLRWILDAHWPSDVLGGSALGYGAAWATLTVMRANGWG